MGGYVYEFIDPFDAAYMVRNNMVMMLNENLEVVMMT